MKLSCSPCLSGRFAEALLEMKGSNLSTKCKGYHSDCKYAGPFAGVVTVAYLKVCENVHRFTDVFWMQGDINFIF